MDWLNTGRKLFAKKLYPEARTMAAKTFFLIVLIPFLAACAGVISKESLREADPEITFQRLIKGPERYKGKVILVGGQILTTSVREGETWIEVLQQPLDWQQKPRETDESYGRFLVLFEKFLDPAIYAGGKKITILGEVQGKKLQPLKEMEYSYPLLLPPGTSPLEAGSRGQTILSHRHRDWGSYPMKGKIWLVLWMAGLMASCAPLSREVLRQVDEALTYGVVQQDPQRHSGKNILWGGVIIETINKQDETVLKVRQTNLDLEKRPKNLDRSAGRFIVRSAGFLDPAIYKEGREITVGGEVAGREVLPLGETKYSYPVILAKEIHLWEKRQETAPLLLWYWDRYPFWGHRSPFWW